MGILLLGVWLILFGIDLAAFVTISHVFLGVFAIVVGAVLLFEGRGMVTNRV